MSNDDANEIFLGKMTRSYVISRVSRVSRSSNEIPGHFQVFHIFQRPKNHDRIIYRVFPDFPRPKALFVLARFIRHDILLCTKIYGTLDRRCIHSIFTLRYGYVNTLTNFSFSLYYAISFFHDFTVSFR